MKLTAREQAALRVIGAQGRTQYDSAVLKIAVGASPRLTAGALCRKGLAEYVHTGDQLGEGFYTLTAAGQQTLAAL